MLFSSVQLLSRVQLFATPWIAARQASLSITNSQSSRKLMSIELVLPSNHLILCRPLLLRPQSFSASGSFQMTQLFASGSQSIGVSASTPVLSMNIQDWCPLGMGWLNLLAAQGTLKSLLQYQVQKHQFFGAQLSLQTSSHIHTRLLEKPQLWLDGPLLTVSLLLNTLFRLVITLLPRIGSFNFMAAVTICSDFGDTPPPKKKNSLPLFPLFPHLFAMKWMDWMPWS